MFFLQITNSESLHGLGKNFQMISFDFPFCVQIVANVKRTLLLTVGNIQWHESSGRCTTGDRRKVQELIPNLLEK